MPVEHLAFTGHIAGFGTRSGIRVVAGHWIDSPFGRFSDVMLQTADDERVLLAPDHDVADFVSTTYHFDRVVVGPVSARLTGDTLTLAAPTFAVEVGIGGPAAIDRLLRLVPGRLATARWWLRAIDPVACRIMPGVHTAGTAGRGRREYYGVRRSRLISSVAGQFGGTDLAGLAALRPPVGFGFASAPATPQIVAVTTRIDMATG
jgi:hypothetical protein